MMCMRLSFVAPTYIPRNFQLLQAIDGSTAQFAWDLPLAADEVNIRGALKAYQVICASLGGCCMYVHEWCVM